jgi:sugar O-acyltransferase (sialic acid O-acetyltransferase NeuD family)
MSEAGLFILGAGGHGRSVYECAKRCGITNIVFVDPWAAAGKLFGCPVVSTLPEVIEPGWALFPAVGDNGKRRRLFLDTARSWASLVSPSAVVGTEAEIGSGTLVSQLAYVGPGAQIGNGVIVNTSAVVEHECIVGDFSHISINATVGGGTKIGKLVFVGAGATIIDHVSIADEVIIGAGATVTRPINTPGTYVGVPARRVR